MIEEGLYQLLSQNAAVQTALGNNGRPAGDSGIYLGRLRMDPCYPALSFRLISSTPDPTLIDPDAIVKSRWQFDCISPSPEAAVVLGRAVILCLNGFLGALPDGTRVTSCIKDNTLDTYYNDANTHDRCIDFLIQYAPGVNQS